MKGLSLKERFLSKVEKTSSCWLWHGKSRSGEYGLFWVGDRVTGRMHMAHRISYELFVGAIPPELTIDHLCRNRNCVNPLHLEAVTNVENVMRGLSGPALNARKTYCKRGHEFTPENTYVQKPQGWRHCLKCYSVRRVAKIALG